MADQECPAPTILICRFGPPPSAVAATDFTIATISSILLGVKRVSPIALCPVLKFGEVSGSRYNGPRGGDQSKKTRESALIECT